MTDTITLAEQRAQRAEQLEAFGSLNLLHIKREVAELLRLIGQGGIFDQYTKHDISHINKMLGLLEWLIPPSTQESMSSADWLMIVLSIYFHDLGMLVTSEEFQNRDSSGFPKFCSELLFTGDDGIDYRSRIAHLADDERERFLYQEFVRQNHAERIRNWIEGKPSNHLGVNPPVASEVEKLLEPLGKQFRRDLALICESHHLDDLGDFSKYKPFQAYGDSDSETANLQYAALLLRTADLLHVTSDRTPSIAFRVISPKDPLSQQEWSKQTAVKRVCSQIARNEEGEADPSLPRDTIEVHAYFSSPNGFFGLNAYLLYVREQVQKSKEWADANQKKNGVSHEFPWNEVDDRHIETEGFMRSSFEFTLDQSRILDLLIGHTLYNDSSVVLRELVQNSLDAVRLYRATDLVFKDPQVSVKWDSKSRHLTVMDNGTGMTQEIITKYLLTVGSSRYQDPEFRKAYPDFSPISRFGIGVLSCFMVADDVDIITCHPEEEKARKLTLRSVHGKYLIQLIDKNEPAAEDITPHGTLVRLKIRPSVDMPDVLDAAKEWVVIPNCDVSVQIDDNDPVKVGFDDAKQALEAQFRATDEFVIEKDLIPKETSWRRRHVRVVQTTLNGVQLAHAVVWNPFIRVWEYLLVVRYADPETARLGTCISGIRVESNSPGFTKRYIVAIANLTGPHAPKTNVARYGLERTAERDTALDKLYRLYFQHAEDQIRTLQNEPEYSLTKAVYETQFFLSELLAGRPRNERGFAPEDIAAPIVPDLLEAAILDARLNILEINGKREAASVNEIHQSQEFCSIDSGFFDSVEWLLREIPSNLSLHDLSKIMPEETLGLPDVPIYRASAATGLNRLVFKNREVSRIFIQPEQQRVDLRWVPAANPANWLSLDNPGIGNKWIPPDLIQVCRGEIEYNFDSSITAVRSMNRIFVIPGTPIAKFLLDQFGSYRTGQDPQKDGALTIISVLFLLFWEAPTSRITIDEAADQMKWVWQGMQQHSQFARNTAVDQLLETSTFLRLVQASSWDYVDPGAADRNRHF